MEQIVAFMLLVGCGADGTTCTEIPAPQPAYSSVADCERELPLQLRMTGTFDAKIVGACKAVSEDLLEQSVSLEWALNRGGELIVDVVAEPELVASTDEIQLAAR